MSVTSSMTAETNRAVQTAAARRVIWTVFGAVAFAFSFCGVNAYAEGTEFVVSQKTVHFAELDLSKPAGAKVLYTRLRQAAKQVCGPLRIKTPQREKMRRTCYEQALGNAVATVNKSTLTALHRSDRTIRLAQASEKMQSRN